MGIRVSLPSLLAAVLLLSAALACPGSSGCGRRKDARRAFRPPNPAALERTTVLAKIPDRDPPPPPPAPPVLGLHAATAGGETAFQFSARGGGVAFILEDVDGFTVFHDGAPGKRYAAVGTPVLSADGKRCAYGALTGREWRMVADGVEGPPFATVRAPVFSVDGAHLAYQAMSGDRWYLVVDGERNGGTSGRYAQHELGAGPSIVFIEDLEGRGRGRLVRSDLRFERETVVGEGVSRIVPNADATRFAAVASGPDGQRVLSFDAAGAEPVARGHAYDSVTQLAFGPDGNALAWTGDRSGSRFVVLGDREARLGSGDHPVGAPAIRPDGKGLALLVASLAGVRVQSFFSGAATGGNVYEDAEGLVFGGGAAAAWVARRGPSWFVVVDGREGPPFDRVVTPQFSPDGERVVYRARQAGRRFVVVADLEGRTVRRLADHDQVFPVIFTADGGSVAYGTKDGPELVWNVEAL